jgi:putative transposase
MDRLARVVVPGYPYHVTHRGNRRDIVFAEREDRDVYLAMLHEYAQKYAMHVWAYCLMTNHIHLIVMLAQPDSLANAIGRTHMRYARWFNTRQGWSGHLWANRFYSTALDAEHLWHGVRYVEANPLRARMVARAEQYEWSSCAAHAGLWHLTRSCAQIVHSPAHVAHRTGRTLLMPATPQSLDAAIRLNTSTGRPTGSSKFVDTMEAALGRLLRPQKVGQKPKITNDDSTQDLFENFNA